MATSNQTLNVGNVQLANSGDNLKRRHYTYNLLATNSISLNVQFISNSHRSDYICGMQAVSQCQWDSLNKNVCVR